MHLKFCLENCSLKKYTSKNVPSKNTFQNFFKKDCFLKKHKNCSLNIEFAKPENQKIHIFYFLRENFLSISKKEKSFLYFPLQEAKFFELRSFF